MMFTVSHCQVRSPQLRFLAHFTQQQLLHGRELDILSLAPRLNLESRPLSVSFLFVSTSSKSVSIVDAAAGAGAGGVAVVALPELRQRNAHVFVELLVRKRIVARVSSSTIVAVHSECSLSEGDRWGLPLQLSHLFPEGLHLSITRVAATARRRPTSSRTPGTLPRLSCLSFRFLRESRSSFSTSASSCFFSSAYPAWSSPREVLRQHLPWHVH